MQVQNVSQEAASTTSTTTTKGATKSNELTGDSFMKLLIAQLQNQDPTQPQDPMAFMNQMIMFNQLEQTIQIRQLLEQSAAAPTTNSSATKAAS